jgi:Rhs element Vgr protein
MAASPLDDSAGDLLLQVLCNGALVAETVQVLSVRVVYGINKVPAATVVLHDDDEANLALRLELSDGADFVPGAAISIKAGYGMRAATIFDGIVLKHALRLSAPGQGRLVLECRDKAVAMTLGRKNANYVDQTDGDIIAKLVGAYAGLSQDVASTTGSHPELVQFNASDWDFMLARAEANGMVVLVDAGKVTVAPPKADGEAQLTLTYGVDLLSFEAELDARSQLGTVGSVAWDPATQEVLTFDAAPVTLGAQGNLDASTLAGVLGLASYRLQSTVPLDNAGLKAWAGGRQLRAALARIRGRMRFTGSALAKAGVVVELAGVGKRFAGTAWLSGVTHHIGDGDWVTEAQFGAPDDAFAARQALAAPPAAGLTVGVSGLQVGVVMKLDGDPEAQSRIQVSLPVAQAANPGVWARLASDYGSDGVGRFFIPEIGDEVVLGFLNDDPSHPVILGSLYSGKRTMPYTLTADNFTKAIVTRSQLKVTFDDDKKVITLSTPGGNTVVLSDEAKGIELTDQNSNKVTLGPDGITLDSPKDILIKAGGKFTVNATGDMTLSGQADLKADASNISATAKAAFTAKGSASAELSASGTTTVKGAAVMIN